MSPRADAAESPAIPLEGKLNDPTTLPRLYAWLARGEWSGLVLVRSGDVERRVYFAEGRIGTAGSNDPVDSLANHLIRAGLLSEEDRSKAAGQLRTPDRGFAFGRQLVKLGLVSERDLMRTERSRVVDIAVATLGLRTGTYACQAGAVAGDAQPPQGLEVPRVVAEGILSTWDANSALEAVGGPDVVLDMVPEMLSDYEATGADEPYDMTLLLANGRRSLRELVETAPLPEAASLRFLAAARLLGCLTVRDVEPALPAADDRTASEDARVPVSVADRVAEEAPARPSVADAGPNAAQVTPLEDPEAAGDAAREDFGEDTLPSAVRSPGRPSAIPRPTPRPRPEAPSTTRAVPRQVLIGLVILLLLGGVAYVAHRGWREVARAPGTGAR